MGDPLDPTSNMGSMISKKHLATVDGYIQKGIDEGAKLLSGGGLLKKKVFLLNQLFLII